MIFATVGGQTPFDRLVRAVDQWAGARGRKDVFAQIAGGDFVPAHVDHARFLDPDQYAARIRECDVVVAHAGMGTIITALELGKPILVLPRRAALRETRNDHQLATAARLSQQGLVHVAQDEAELERLLDGVDDLVAAAHASGLSKELEAAIRAFIARA